MIKRLCIECVLYEYCVEWVGVTSSCESCENFEKLHEE